MNRKRKIYYEDIEVLKWLAKNVPKQKESEWIRSATAAKLKESKK